MATADHDVEGTVAAGFESLAEAFGQALAASPGHGGAFERIVKPLGVAAWIGMPEAELPRVAQLYSSPPPPQPLPPQPDPDPYKVGFAYLTNDLQRTDDKRGVLLVETLRDLL